MYARYGTYQHPDNEVNIARVAKRCRYSTRLRKLTTIVDIVLEGELLADTQATIDAKILQLENAYSVEGRDFGFFTDAGALTNHQLISTAANCVTPVRITGPSYLQGDAAEFAVKRTYQIVLTAEFLTPDSQLVEWFESIEYVGNAGPRYEYADTYEGPIRQLVNKRTMQKIIQSGRAVALQTPILPPGSLLPAFELQDQRRVTLGSGRRLGRMALFYPTEWTYTHITPSYQEIFPVTR